MKCENRIRQAGKKKKKKATINKLKESKASSR